MIERLQRIATHLRRFRILMALIALLSLGVLILSLVENPWLNGDALLIPAVLSLTWAVMLLSFAGLFEHLPQKPDAKAGWRVRLAYKVRHATVWLLGVMVVALCGSLVILTYQLLRVGSVG